VKPAASCRLLQIAQVEGVVEMVKNGFEFELKALNGLKEAYN